MSAWRRIALDTFPELRIKIEHADSPMALWIELGSSFQDAFLAGDDDSVRRFFRFAEWCLDTADQQATDSSTAAWCAFYEHVPRIAGLVEQLHRYLPRSRFVQVEEAFRPHTAAEKFARLRDSYGYSSAG